MKLIISKQEYLQLREIIINIDNKKVTDEFNRIVTDQNPHINAATTSETLTLNISDELSKEIGDILIKHSKTFGKNLSISLSNLPKIVSNAKNLLNDLSTAISNRKK